VPIHFFVAEAGIFGVCEVGAEKTSKNLSLSLEKEQKTLVDFVQKSPVSSAEIAG